MVQKNAGMNHGVTSQKKFPRIFPLPLIKQLLWQMLKFNKLRIQELNNAKKQLKLNNKSDNKVNSKINLKPKQMSYDEISCNRLLDYRKYQLNMIE